MRREHARVGVDVEPRPIRALAGEEQPVFSRSGCGELGRGDANERVARGGVDDLGGRTGVLASHENNYSP